VRSASSGRFSFFLIPLNPKFISRSTLILIVSVYGLLVVLGMLVAPEALLQGFGVPAPDKYHLAQHQLMGMPILGLSVIGLMIRNAEPSLGLRAYLAGNATNLIAFTALTAYEIHCPRHPRFDRAPHRQCVAAGPGPGPGVPPDAVEVEVGF